MTIEIADRLIKLRKQKGLSQEELADKLGISRQAVSKWERAEASPDTDNLICLAKLYGVSLDELLSNDDDIDTIVKEQVKSEEENEGVHIKSKKGETVDITDEGIHIVDDEGQKVSITDEGIHLRNKNGEVKKVPDKGMVIIGSIECALFTLALVGYILLGALANMWWNGWVILFIPGIIMSIVRCIYRKNPNKLNVAFIACFAFFFVNMVVPGTSANLWHPMWVVFLAIPVYHSLFGTINKVRGKSEDEDDKD